MYCKTARRILVPWRIMHNGNDLPARMILERIPDEKLIINE